METCQDTSCLIRCQFRHLFSSTELRCLLSVISPTFSLPSVPELEEIKSSKEIEYLCCSIKQRLKIASDLLGKFKTNYQCDGTIIIYLWKVTEAQFARETFPPNYTCSFSRLLFPLWLWTNTAIRSVLTFCYSFTLYRVFHSSKCITNYATPFGLVNQWG